jgi:hypothetical protein
MERPSFQISKIGGVLKIKEIFKVGWATPAGLGPL